MKRVRALDKNSGEFVKILHADEVTPEARYTYHHACLDTGCTQSYHWRKSFRQDGNRIQIPATFVENRSTDHKKGCRYDFEKIAGQNRDVAFFQNNAFHLRINFPLGGAYSDISVPYGRIDTARLKNSWDRSRLSLVGLGSLGAVCSFLEKEFGSIEAIQTDSLKLHYQGQNFDWRTMFAASDGYEKIINVPVEAVSKLNESRLALVKLSHEISKSAKGKSRFACEPQDAKVNGRLRRVQPVLVSGHESVTSLFREMGERKMPALIAARPFEASRSGKGGFTPRKTHPVTLYVASPDQIAPVAQNYWRPRPAQQLGFDFSLE